MADTHYPTSTHWDGTVNRSREEPELLFSEECVAIKEAQMRLSIGSLSMQSITPKEAQMLPSMDFNPKSNGPSLTNSSLDDSSLADSPSEPAEYRAGTVLERLREFPQLRETPWRPGQVLIIDGLARQKQQAIVLSSRGQISPITCDTCAKGRSRFALCITLDNWFLGACAGCLLGGSGKACSLRHQTTLSGGQHGTIEEQLSGVKWHSRSLTAEELSAIRPKFDPTHANSPFKDASSEASKRSVRLTDPERRLLEEIRSRKDPAATLAKNELPPTSDFRYHQTRMTEEELIAIRPSYDPTAANTIFKRSAPARFGDKRCPRITTAERQLLGEYRAKNGYVAKRRKTEK